MSKPVHIADSCLNCGTHVGSARYCGNCGQEHIVEVFSMRQLAGHYVEDFLSLDSRLLRSLGPLLTRPGYLTTRYLQGYRNSYIRPLRLYLLASILFFAVLRFQVHPGDTVKITRNGETVTLNELTMEERDKLGDAAFNALAHTKTVDAAEDSSASVLASAGRDSARAALVDSLARSNNFHFGRVSWWPWLNKYLEQREKRLESLDRAELGRLFLSELSNQAPKAIFLLLPTIALILKILYFRRSRFYMEHFIFSLHWHSFLFLLLTLCIFLPWQWLRVTIILASPVYLLLAQRHYYQQGWIRTILKHQILMSSYAVLMPLFAALLAAFAAATI